VLLSGAIGECRGEAGKYLSRARERLAALAVNEYSRAMESLTVALLAKIAPGESTP
jgi:hypothetical protein